VSDVLCVLIGAGQSAVEFILKQTDLTTVLTTVSQLPALLAVVGGAQTKVTTVIAVADSVMGGGGVSADVKDKLQKLNLKLILWDELEAMGTTVVTERKGEPVLRMPEPNDTAIICYTSGTTGSPKGVIQTHLAYTAFVGSAISALPAMAAAGPLGQNDEIKKFYAEKKAAAEVAAAAAKAAATNPTTGTAPPSSSSTAATPQPTNKAPPKMPPPEVILALLPQKTRFVFMPLAHSMEQMGQGKSVVGRAHRFCVLTPYACVWLYSE